MIRAGKHTYMLLKTALNYLNAFGSYIDLKEGLLPKQTWNFRLKISELVGTWRRIRVGTVLRQYRQYS